MEQIWNNLPPFGGTFECARLLQQTIQPTKQLTAYQAPAITTLQESFKSSFKYSSMSFAQTQPQSLLNTSNLIAKKVTENEVQDT